jgi:hypothetical protein
MTHGGSNGWAFVISKRCKEGLVFHHSTGRLIHVRRVIQVFYLRQTEKRLHLSPKRSKQKTYHDGTKCLAIYMNIKCVAFLHV